MTMKFYVAACVVTLCSYFLLVNSTCAAQKNPCSDDIAKLCNDVEPGGGAIIDCLANHENELSQGCRDFQAKMAGKRAQRQERVKQLQALRQACEGDVARFCKDVKPGRGAVARCLEEHQGELSAQCKEGIAAARAAQQNRTGK